MEYTEDAIIRSTKTQKMMMYQILCGHVNYVLGKTRMWVKKPKRHFILDSCTHSTSSSYEFWRFELMVINVVFKFGLVELMVGL
jgi:fructose-1,6-bisphosphatase